ncbi:hypothetical protein, partial [Vibrio mediterranei]|uniref:hypothetical protein n=1 Tax=Vibrio mediterranei TaxID=689 RepID=UPI001EFEB847
MAELKVVNETVVLSNGDIEYHPTAKEIYGYKYKKTGFEQVDYHDISNSTEFSALKIRKRPVNFSYRVEIESNQLLIHPTVNGFLLSKSQLETCREFGYFIDEQCRLHMALTEDLDKLSQALAPKKLSEQLNQVAKLRSSNELSLAPEQLI